jgi:hypothetical protein
MTVTPDQDAPRGSESPGFSDAVTYAFADPGAELCGVARLGVADGMETGMAVIFRGGEPVTVAAEAGALNAETVRPLESWRLRFDGDVGLDLAFEALGPPLELDEEGAAAKAGGMNGFDHLCRVEGQVGGAPFAGLGQRGRSWGNPDWERMALARSLSAWLDDEHAVSAVAVRPAKARSHADEAVAAFVFDSDREEDPVRAVADPRISTAYDGEGRQRRAGLELYVDSEDAYPRRAAGEVVAGTSLDLGHLRLDCAFFRWHMEGREGVGRYDVLRRVA